jgi:methanogenic corrinoid protein MtbC1
MAVHISEADRRATAVVGSGQPVDQPIALRRGTGVGARPAAGAVAAATP